eukprot:TRINITY_DN4248_c0_g2_i8.p1 TRINITY_DN4248_c0_g2~~TRINITY_DN4248_c0_g2_i8.p1  ORF type:complete len:134 (+),score=27.13 TRINITY_DN4248_c0_g2_i8:90-491(+)
MREHSPSSGINAEYGEKNPKKKRISNMHRARGAKRPRHGVPDYGNKRTKRTAPVQRYFSAPLPIEQKSDEMPETGSEVLGSVVGVTQFNFLPSKVIHIPGAMSQTLLLFEEGERICVHGGFQVRSLVVSQIII